MESKRSNHNWLSDVTNEDSGVLIKQPSPLASPFHSFVPCFDLMADEQIQFGNDLIQYSSTCPWPEFPHDIQIQIMERLPLECCYRLRSVCKAWNHLLSSTHFIRIIGSRQPWLLLCTPKLELPFLLYSFFTNSWRPLSLSFLQHHKDVSGQVNYRGSASGMLLLDVMPIARWGNMATLPRLSVCNPLNRTVFSLPQMPSEIHVMGKGIVPGDELGSYVVLVIGMKTTSNSVVAVEAYDSLSKSWRTTGTLPDNLGLMMDTMIFCKEFFYCLTTSLHGCDDGQVVAYNIKEGNATIIPLPATDKNDHYWPRLLSSRGGCDLLIVGAIEEDHILKDLVIWECNQNCKLHYCWTEIGRMPASVCDEFRRSSCSTWFECIRVGEYICFRTHESTKIVTYNLLDGSWSWLPECPPAYAHYRYVRLNSMVLEPRPDVEVTYT